MESKSGKTSRPSFEEFVKSLQEFTGTENWYRHSINRSVLYTDGVKYLADTCGSHWLLDDIAISQYSPKAQKEDFQVWVLKVDDSKATLVCEDGNGHKVYSKKIEFTDFPYPEVTIWMVDNTMLLKSEY